ncbi:MAG: HNH nuclease family protein [Nitrospirae bacterium]|nr:HNH nuclease family protein [Nitrospirota bacterium]
MQSKRNKVYKKQRPEKINSNKSVADIVRELKGQSSPVSTYRERSLNIHGLICAKCAREFDYKDRHLLTVHHKDGNPRNNPPNGSNWENLCVYCHEDEHSRGLLGDYFTDKK